jgi:RNA polymerase sigma factor (sigma-70 family)
VLARVADGDLEALEELYDRYKTMAYSIAYRITNDVTLAEDVVQDAFLGAWRNAARYIEGRGSVKTWLLSIVHHRAIDAIRRRRPTTQLPEREEVPPAAFTCLTSGPRSRRAGRRGGSRALSAASRTSAPRRSSSPTRRSDPAGDRDPNGHAARDHQAGCGQLLAMRHSLTGDEAVERDGMEAGTHDRRAARRADLRGRPRPGGRLCPGALGQPRPTPSVPSRPVPEAPPRSPRRVSAARLDASPAGGPSSALKGRIAGRGRRPRGATVGRRRRPSPPPGRRPRRRPRAPAYAVPERRRAERPGDTRRPRDPGGADAVLVIGSSAHGISCSRDARPGTVKGTTWRRSSTSPASRAHSRPCSRLRPAADRAASPR